MSGLLAVFCNQAIASTVVDGNNLIGVVIDSTTGQPVSSAKIMVVDRKASVSTDDSGRFSVLADSKKDSIRVSATGYEPFSTLATNGMIVSLVPLSVTLDEIVVTPTKEKYSKRNNPAVELMAQLRADSHKTDPLRQPFFNVSRYERLTGAINDFNPQKNYEWLGSDFAFLNQHLDVSDISGRLILNVFTKEKFVKSYFRREQNDSRELIEALRDEGLDSSTTNPDAIRLVLEDIFREVDIYSNTITLLQNRFVSPLSVIASDFYKFYLADTVMMDDGVRCAVLSFVPHTPESWGFTGRLYVPIDSPVKWVKKAQLYLPHAKHVNWVNALTIEQDYTLSPEGARLKQHDVMRAEATLLPGLPELYLKRLVAYADHGFNDNDESDSLFDYASSTILSPNARQHDNDYWATHRLTPLSWSEANLSLLTQRLRAVPTYYWSEKIAKIIAGGFIHTGHKSKFDIGPIDTSLSYNTAEGIRLQFGGMTTAHFSPHWFARGYVGYGVRDQKMKYSIETEYSFNRKQYHSREFPMSSLRFSSLYLLDKLGQKYTHTTSDNILMSWKRLPDTRVTYRRANTFEFIHEWRNNLSVNIGTSFERQEATPWVPFTTNSGAGMSHYDELMFIAKVRFVPGERITQGAKGRASINRDAITVELSHFHATKGLMGTMFDVDRTELQLTKRIWLSAFGYINTTIKGGYCWTASPFMYLPLPNANTTYTVQSGTFTLMNPLEFINDSYAMVDMTYALNGLLFNRLPLLRRTGLRELITFKSLWGRLSDRNNPYVNKSLLCFPTDVVVTPMNTMPYMEIGVGVDNIFNFFRLDYVWRLSYRNAPMAPNCGLRFGMQLQF